MSPYPPLPPYMTCLRKGADHSLEHTHRAEFKRRATPELELIDREDHFPAQETYADPSSPYLLGYAIRMHILDLIFVVVWSCICLRLRRQKAHLSKTGTVLSKHPQNFLVRFIIVDVFGRTFSLSLNSFSWKEHVFASVLTAAFVMLLQLPMVASSCIKIAITQLAGYSLAAVLRQILTERIQPPRSPSTLSRRASVSHDSCTPTAYSWSPTTIDLPSASIVFVFSFAASVIVPWLCRLTNVFERKSYPVPAPDELLQNGVPYIISKLAEKHSYPVDETPLPSNPWFLVRATALLAVMTGCQILFQNRCHCFRVRDRRLHEVRIATGNPPRRRASGILLRIPDGCYGQLFFVAACAAWGVLPRWAALLSFFVAGYLVLTHNVMVTILKHTPVLPLIKRWVVNISPDHPFDMKTRLEVLVYNLVLCPILQWLMRHYNPVINKTHPPPARSPLLARITSNVKTMAKYLIKISCYWIHNRPRTRPHVLRESSLTPYATQSVFSAVQHSRGGGQVPILNLELLSPEQRKGRRMDQGLIRISTAKDISSWRVAGPHRQTAT